MINSSQRKKVLLLDGQIFQTEAWDRGMGKYMLQLMKQLSELKPSNIELKILFNSQITTNTARYEVIQYLCPNFEQLFADLPYAKEKGSTSTQYKRALDDYISANRLNSSHLTYMITTLFSFDIFSEYPNSADEKVMVFYDLIPLMQWSDLGGYFPPHLYMGRFERVYESDVIYCISETTREDVVNTFGIDINKTVNINGGFTEHHLDSVKPTSFIVPKKYILFPTGNLPHKNNELVFRAFKEVLKSEGDMHLLVTSKFNDTTKSRLQKICKKNVIFTQNVSDEELQYLYKNAAMILFASKYEGLGLPVLDAVFHDKPVVASSISVFREMSDDAFFYFDVDDYISAGHAIIRALNVGEFMQKKKLYPGIISKYDWRRVGASVYARMEDELHRTAETANGTILSKKMKIAIVSSNPGIEGRIGRVSEQLYSRINQVASISYFFDSCGLKHDEMERPTFLDYIDDVNVYDLCRLTLNEYRKFDHVFYLIDDKSLSFMISRYVASLPGHIIFDSTVNQGSIMFKAIALGAMGVVSVERNDSDMLDMIEGYIRSTVISEDKSNEMVKILKSYAPNVIKLAYMKRNVN